MLLKVGAVMMLLSLAFAASVAAVVGFRSDTPTTTPPSAEPQAAVEKTMEERKFDPGQKLEIYDGPGEADDGPDEKPAPDSRPKPFDPGQNGEADDGPDEKLAPDSRPKPLPVSMPDWPEPNEEEVAVANAPRYYQPTSEADMTLTVEVLGLYEVPILSSPSYEVLDSGLMHEPETSLPSDGGAQRNVFVAGHYLGWPGTASHLVFYNLDKLQSGDEVVLEDSGGRTYKYRVSESFEAGPEESWVMGQEVGRDMLTLQTCVPPSFEERLIVRADRTA